MRKGIGIAKPFSRNKQKHTVSEMTSWNNPLTHANVLLQSDGDIISPTEVHDAVTHGHGNAPAVEDYMRGDHDDASAKEKLTTPAVSTKATKEQPAKKKAAPKKQPTCQTTNKKETAETEEAKHEEESGSEAVPVMPLPSRPTRQARKPVFLPVPNLLERSRRVPKPVQLTMPVASPDELNDVIRDETQQPTIIRRRSRCLLWSLPKVATVRFICNRRDSNTVFCFCLVFRTFRLHILDILQLSHQAHRNYLAQYRSNANSLKMVVNFFFFSHFYVHQRAAMLVRVATIDATVCCDYLDAYLLALYA